MNAPSLQAIACAIALGCSPRPIEVADSAVDSAVDTAVDPCANPGWAHLAIDVEGDVGQAPVIAIDGNRTRLLYLRADTGALRFADDAGGTWSTRTVAPSVRVAAWDLAARDGVARVAFVDTALRVIDPEQPEVVHTPAAAVPTGRPAVAIDRDGATHILYSDYDDGGFGEPSGGLRHLTDATGTWVDTPVMDGADAPDILADDAVHGAWIVRGELWVGGLGADGWAAAPVPTGSVSATPHLASGPEGRPYVLLQSDALALLLRPSGSGWTESSWPGPAATWLGSTTAPMGLAVDGLGDPWPAFAGADGLPYLGATSLAPGRLSTTHPDVARAADGTLRVAWYDWSEGDLVLAWPSDCANTYGRPLGGWTIDTVAPDPSWASGPQSSQNAIAFDPRDDSPLVAWAWLNGACCPDVFVARREGGSWHADRVADDGSRYGPSPSLAVDSKGVAWLAFVGTDGLEVAHRDGAWSTPEPVDTSPPLDAARVLVGPDDAVHLLYSTGQALRHALRLGDGWVTVDVDPGIPDHFLVGLSADIAADGTLHALYGDHYGELRHAWLDGDDWQVEVVAGTYGATALHGDPLWLGWAAGGVVLGEPASDGWRTTRVDRADVRALALASWDDRPAFVYSGGRWPTGGLRLAARQPDGSWLRERIDPDGTEPVTALDAAGRVHAPLLHTQGSTVPALPGPSRLSWHPGELGEVAGVLTSFWPASRLVVRSRLVGGVVALRG